MSYKVHRFDIDMETGAAKLETFLNGLGGEVVAIVPNVRKTTLAQIYGVTRKVDFLLIIERT
jgi:GTPase Era involved in 16S rRNA processing